MVWFSSSKPPIFSDYFLIEVLFSMEWVHSFISLYLTIVSIIVNFLKQVLLLNFPHATTCIIGEFASSCTCLPSYCTVSTS